MHILPVGEGCVPKSSRNILINMKLIILFYIARYLTSYSEKQVLFDHPEFQNYSKKAQRSACLDNIAMDLQETSGDF
jgi:hypothetical protein